MNYPIPISSVSVIIAYRGSDRHLLGTFNSLKMWFDNITIHEKSAYKKSHYVFFKDVPCCDLFFTKCLTPEPCETLICLEHPVDEVVKKSLELLGV